MRFALAATAAAAAAAAAVLAPASAQPGVPKPSGQILADRNADAPDLSPIMSTSFFEEMNDAQLEAYFLAGTAVVPSQEPPYNATGTPTWDLCAGQPLINAFTANSSIAQSMWPAGLQNTLNNAFNRMWWGKVAYNDGSNPNVTQMWNLMFSNHTVSLTGAAYIADSSWLTQDGKPSVMLDYTDTVNIAFREMYDEMRYMANNVWLGRIWWGIPTNSFQKRSHTKWGEVKDRAVLAALNATGVHASMWGGLVGPGSPSKVEMEGKFPLGWFAMQCVGPQAVPKLRYSAWARWDVVRDLHHGFVTADYRLPSLNGKDGAGKGAVSGPGYPNPGNDRGGRLARWHIWPGKLSNVNALGNFTQLQPFEKENPILRDDAWALAVAETAAYKDGSRVTHASGYEPTKAEVQRMEGDRLIPGAALLLGHAAKDSSGLSFPDRKPLDAINASAWAIDIIAAVNEAVREAKENPVGGWNPLARAVAEVKAEGQLMVALALDSVAAVRNQIYQDIHDPPGKPNLTKAGVEDYFARVAAAKALAKNTTGHRAKRPTHILPNVTFDKDGFVEGVKAILASNASALKARHRLDWGDLGEKANLTALAEELEEKVDVLKAALVPQKLIGHSSYAPGFPGTEHLHMQRVQNPAVAAAGGKRR